MLQVATGRFFDGAERYECRKSVVLYGAQRVGQIDIGDSIQLVGSAEKSDELWQAVLSFNTGLAIPAGGARPGGLVATGEREITDQFTALLQVVSQGVWTIEPERIRRAKTVRGWPLPALLREQELDVHAVGRDLMDALSLPRETFLKVVASSRAIDRAIRAAEFSYDAAFANLVFAIEGLVPPNDREMPWEDYPHETRQKLDEVLGDADPDVAARVRAVLLEDRTLRATARFMAFVKETLPRDYFARPDAVPRSHMWGAVKRAYDARSGFVHALDPVRKPNGWSYEHPLVWHDGEPHLSLHGAFILATELVRAVVRRGPHSPTESGVNWRKDLPGIVQMRLADEYWLHNPDAYTKDTVRQRFADVAAHALEVHRGGDKSLLDLREALERCKKLISNTPKERRAALVGLVVLWTWFAPEHASLPWSDDFIQQHSKLLDQQLPEVGVLYVLSGQPIDWKPEAADKMWKSYVSKRYRNKAGSVRLPHLMEAALLAAVANVHLEAGDRERFQALCDDVADELGSRPEARAYVLDRRDEGQPLEPRRILGLVA